MRNFHKNNGNDNQIALIKKIYIFFNFLKFFNYLFFLLPDLQSIRRLLEHDTSSSVCPSCRISFDKGKRRKLIDTCGHERCYSCMFRNDQCPMCMNSSLKGKNAKQIFYFQNIHLFMKGVVRLHTSFNNYFER